MSKIASARAGAVALTYLALIVLTAPVMRAQPQTAPGVAPEYELKAMFFVTLARYAQWPTNSFNSSNDPVVIGIFGHNPFGNKLDSLVSHEQIQGHPLQVINSSDIEELKGSHMIFFGGVSPALMELSLARLARRPILTVSDQRGFLDAGGMIELFLNNENRVRLKVSRNAISKADLNLSPTLWRLAEKVALYDLSPSTVVTSATKPIIGSHLMITWASPPPWRTLSGP